MIALCQCPTVCLSPTIDGNHTDLLIWIKCDPFRAVTKPFCSQTVRLIHTVYENNENASGSFSGSRVFKLIAQSNTLPRTSFAFKYQIWNIIWVLIIHLITSLYCGGVRQGCYHSTMFPPWDTLYSTRITAVKLENVTNEEINEEAWEIKATVIEIINNE